MPSLREQMCAVVRYLREHPPESYGEQCARELEIMIRQTWANERIHIPPPDSRKDPARADRIREAAKRLPTGVVAQRFGVHRATVNRIIKK
jgi:uncharacterized protein (DUF2267 family)